MALQLTKYFLPSIQTSYCSFSVVFCKSQLNRKYWIASLVKKHSLHLLSARAVVTVCSLSWLSSSFGNVFMCVVFRAFFKIKCCTVPIYISFTYTCSKVNRKTPADFGKLFTFITWGMLYIMEIPNDFPEVPFALRGNSIMVMRPTPS